MQMRVKSTRVAHARREAVPEEGGNAVRGRGAKGLLPHLPLLGAALGRLAGGGEEGPDAMDCSPQCRLRPQVGAAQRQRGVKVAGIGTRALRQLAGPLPLTSSLQVAMMLIKCTRLLALLASFSSSSANSAARLACWLTIPQGQARDVRYGACPSM